MPAFEAIPIRTQRLILRPYRDGDEEQLFGIFSDPAVMRFMSSPPWTSIERARDTIARDVAAFAGGEHLGLAIERTQDARLIGQCTLFRLSESNRRAEIGYCLASRNWGKGYMNEALRALLHYGFERLNLNRVEADVDPRNAASVRALERLSFVREGLLRERWIVNAEVTDSEIYGLLRRDWQTGA